MFTIIKAPDTIVINKAPSVFLAGSIENGKAEDWQTSVENYLSKKHTDLTILNPRRFDWDSSWEQTIRNKKFYEQVKWENVGLDIADFIFMNFLPETLSPITLLELGLCANSDSSNKVIICCPDGFWRKGNVEFIAEYYDIALYDNIEDALIDLDSRIFEFDSHQKVY